MKKVKGPTQAEIKARIESGRRLMDEKRQLVQNLEKARILATENKCAFNLSTIRDIAERMTL